MTVFLDTNVLIYILDDESPFHKWSEEEFIRWRALGPTAISDIVYAEFTIGMESKDAADAAVGQLAIERVRASSEALFVAGRAFKSYRENGGARNRILPDFIVGATAQSAGAPLITVNAGDFAGYFPDLRIISPDEAAHAE